MLATVHATLGRGNTNAAQQLIALGVEPTSRTSEEYGAMILAELPKRADIVKKSGATAD